MLRTIIIDDEEHQRQSIAKMLSLYCQDAELTGTADSIKSGIEIIRRLKPDLVLLDIRLRDGTGFDLLSQLNPVDFKVIFITAFDEYAIRAFRFSALDYLLKPVDPEELAGSVRRASQNLLQVFTEQLNQLREHMQQGNEGTRKIVVRTFESIYLVGIADILYCESDGNYTTLHLAGQPDIIASTPLKDYEELLSPLGFFRIHKSYLINLGFISRFDKADGGFVVLTDGSRVPVASRKRDILLEMFSRLK